MQTRTNRCCGPAQPQAWSSCISASFVACWDGPQQLPPGPHPAPVFAHASLCYNLARPNLYLFQFLGTPMNAVAQLSPAFPQTWPSCVLTGAAILYSLTFPQPWFLCLPLGGTAQQGSAHHSSARHASSPDPAPVREYCGPVLHHDSHHSWHLPAGTHKPDTHQVGWPQEPGQSTHTPPVSQSESTSVLWLQFSIHLHYTTPSPVSPHSLKYG